MHNNSWHPPIKNTPNQFSQWHQSLLSKKLKRVFVSFHMNDRYAKELLVQQAKSDKFELNFINYAVNEPFDSKWKTHCAERIRKTSATICLIGRVTYQREAVLWELNKSYELGKKVIGVRIHRHENNPTPLPIILNGSRVIGWNINQIVDELNT